MKYLVTHSYPEKKKKFTSDEIEFVLENFKDDWRIISFSNYHIKNERITYLNSIIGVLYYFLRFKVSIFKKFNILKKVFSGNIKDIVRNMHSLFLSFHLIYKIKLNPEDLLFSYWFTRPSIIAYYVNYLIGIKYVIQGHGSDIYIYPPFNLKSIIGNAQLVITIGNANREYLLKKFPGIENKVKVFKLGIKNTSGYTINYELRQNRLIYIGRYEKVKGIDILIDAIVSKKKIFENNNYFFDIYGGGPLKKQIMNKIKKQKLENIIKLNGWLNRKEVLDKLSDAKALLIPSRSEGIPVIIMEAFSCGTPAIANNVGGVPEIVMNKKNGLLNNNICSSDFINKILEFIELSDADKIKLSQNAIELCNNSYRLEENLYNKYSFLNKYE